MSDMRGDLGLQRPPGRVLDAIDLDLDERAHDTHHPHVPVALTGAPKLCPHSRKGQRPEQCSQCLGIEASRITHRAIDEIEIVESPHPWALADVDQRADDPVSRYLAERRAERERAAQDSVSAVESPSTRSERSRAAAQKRWDAWRAARAAKEQGQ